MSQNNTNLNWYKLDNSAIIYTATQNRTYANVYRLAAIMNEEVQPDKLQLAFEKTLPRFPYFSVRLRRGAFWAYLDPNLCPIPPVIFDNKDPCPPILSKDNNGYPIKVLYYNKRISVEIFHVLTDGHGGLVFMRTLLAEYIKLCYPHVNIPCEKGVLDTSVPAPSGEYEDAYFKYGTAGSIIKINNTKAYKVRATPISADRNMFVISGIFPVAELIKLAKSYQVTVNEYVTALLLHILHEKQKKEPINRKRPVRIAVPVNCRHFFPTESLRNFILLISPFIDPSIDDYTFEEILFDVKNYMKYNLNPKFLRAMMTGNIKSETMVWVRPVPLYIKRKVVGAFYKRLGDKQTSAIFSNLGVFTVPDELGAYISRMEVVMGRPYSHCVNCALITCGDTATLTFASMIQETDIEREFFRRLVEAGIHVEIESNR